MRLAFIKSASTAMAEDSSSKQELEADKDYDHEDMDASLSAYCGCFRGIWSPWRRPDGYVLYQKEEQEEEEEEVVKEKWLEKKLKKVKVLSEVLGGPRWKNLIRYRWRLMRMNKRIRRMQFQYDPKSYALNFDDGTAEKEGDAAAYVDFSARFADPMGMNRGDLRCHEYDHTELSKVIDLIGL